MENKAHAMVAGAFVLLVTALLVLLSVWLMRDKTDRDLYEMSTNETLSGIQPQGSVLFRGVPVGKIENIGFDSKVRGNVLIRISVDHGAPVTKSVFATVASQGVTGLGFIQLDDTGESAERLLPNDSDPPRIPLKVSGFNKLLRQGDVIMNQLEEVTNRVNKALTDENLAVATAAVKHMGEAAQSVSSLATSIQTTVDAQLNPQRVNLPALVKNADVTLQSVRSAADEVTLTARRLNEKGGPLDKLSQGGTALASGVETFSASTLPKLSEVADETARTMRQLRRTVNNVDDNPQALIFGNGPPLPGPGEPGFSATGANK